jgi:hypothetical protein
MKLRDFIERLQQLDPDAVVKIESHGDYENGEIQISWQDPDFKVEIMKGRRVVCIQ